MDKKPQPAFVLFVNGDERQGKEAMGRELGTILETEIPAFLVELGTAVAKSGMDFDAWNTAEPEALERIAARHLA